MTTPVRGLRWVGQDTRCWTDPLTPHDEDAARWAAFCRTVEDRLEALRAEGEPSAVFSPPLLAVSAKVPLPVGPSLRSTPWRLPRTCVRCARAYKPSWAPQRYCSRHCATLAQAAARRSA